jgi:3-oxoacyl-[acyl-carrier protein] reductase
MTKETARRVGVSFEQFIQDRANSIPVARSGLPSDIAHAVAFFADEASSFISGQVLYVAGGPKN